jgi:porin
MKNSSLWLFMLVLAIAGICPADESHDNSKIVADFWHCASPTNGFWGLNDQLTLSGIEVGLGLTTAYQANVKGGTSTNDHRGRHLGKYDLGMSVDMEKLLGIEGGSLFVHGWGGWPNEEGIDTHSVGSAWGINALSVSNRTMDIVECFYETPLFSENLTIAIGKLDFTGIFDVSKYADDECCQFLNASLVDDPTIPFPEQGLGFVLNLAITDSWYIMAGVVDAQADGRETGFRTAFHNEDYFFYALETGITPQLNCDEGAMPGAYRVGMWMDGQDKARFSNQKNSRDDIGLYLSCDQLLTRENSDPEDTQGLGVFGRFGYADSNLNEFENFWSIGLQYQGLIAGRDHDVLSGAFAQGMFSDYAGANEGNGYTENDESLLEVYYNAQVTPWFHISPNIQYIAGPGGDKTNKDAVVFGLRTQMVF